MRPQCRIYEFGPYRLDVAEACLSRDGQKIAVGPKVFDLLTALVEAHGQTLSMDELLQSVWRGTSVQESTVAVKIDELRRALGDETYIETVARRGYRFTVEVKRVMPEAAAPQHR